MSSPPPRLPRQSSRPSAGGDGYVWLGVVWLVVLAGGFIGLIAIMFPAIINFRFVLGFTGFIGFNVLGHYWLGRWVARRIASTMTPEEEAEQHGRTGRSQPSDSFDARNESAG